MKKKAKRPQYSAALTGMATMTGSGFYDRGRFVTTSGGKTATIDADGNCTCSEAPKPHAQHKPADADDHAAVDGVTILAQGGTPSFKVRKQKGVYADVRAVDSKRRVCTVCGADLGDRKSAWCSSRCHLVAMSDDTNDDASLKLRVQYLGVLSLLAQCSIYLRDCTEDTADEMRDLIIEALEDGQKLIPQLRWRQLLHRIEVEV